MSDNLQESVSDSTAPTPSIDINQILTTNQKLMQYSGMPYNEATRLQIGSDTGITEISAFVFGSTTQTPPTKRGQILVWLNSDNTIYSAMLS